MLSKTSHIPQQANSLIPFPAFKVVTLIGNPPSHLHDALHLFPGVLDLISCTSTMRVSIRYTMVLLFL